MSAETMSSSLCVPYVSRLMCPFIMCVPSYASPYSCVSFTLCQQQPCDPWFDLVWLLCPPLVSCRSRAPGRCCSGLRLSNPRTTPRQSRPSGFLQCAIGGGAGRRPSCEAGRGSTSEEGERRGRREEKVRLVLKSQVATSQVFLWMVNTTLTRTRQ